jgi:hypothetical protein
MKRTTRATRHDDPPHLLVARGIPPLHSIAGWVALIAGWLAFAAGAIRCLLSTPHP